jgi:hypothetical protein
MATDNAATPVVDDEWDVKPPPKKAGGDDEWSVTPPNAAPDPKTGHGMENYALQQSHSLFTPNQWVGTDAHGQPIYNKPPNVIDKAADEHTANQVRLGAAENRASQSPTPVTSAAMGILPVLGIGASVAEKGLGPTLSAIAKPVAKTVVGAAGGAAAGGYGGRQIGGMFGKEGAETGGRIGSTLGGLAGGFFGGMNREPAPPPEVFPVSEGPGPYTGPSSVPKPEAVGPKIFQPGTGGAGPQGRVGNEGSAARFTNESAYNLARKGSREAIMTLGRRGIEPPPNSRYIMGDVDTDRVVYNPREVTRFDPTGEALRNMEAPEKGGRSRIIAPDTGVQGTKVPVGPQRFPGGEEKRFTPGTSPTGVERRTQAMQDYQNAIDTTPPGQLTPGEKLAQDTKIAQAGKPSGIEEGDARRFIAQDSELYARFRKLDAAANAGDRAAQKERDSMLVQAMNDLKKIQ